MDEAEHFMQAAAALTFACILMAHSIEFIIQDNQVAAFMQVCKDGAEYFGEWMLFDQSTPRNAVYDWLGY